MPHWRGVLHPEEVVPFFRSANGTAGLLMRDLAHNYPPLIVLRSGAANAEAQQSHDAVTHATVEALHNSTPYRLAVEAKAKGNASLRVAGIRGSGATFKCAATAAGCVPFF